MEIMNSIGKELKVKHYVKKKFDILIYVDNVYTTKFMSNQFRRYLLL